MANDKEPVWSKIKLRQSVDDILKYGPSIEVIVSDVIGGPNVNALAQIDTGAAGTGISKPLATALNLKPGGRGEVHQPGLPPIHAPYFRVRIALPSGDIETDVVGLITLDPPHDILIGRDFLARCRLTVDFTAGTTTLHIRATP